MIISSTWQETSNLNISSTFQNGKLVTKATGIVNASADKVMNSHTSENYASVLGIEKYEWFPETFWMRWEPRGVSALHGPIPGLKKQTSFVWPSILQPRKPKGVALVSHECATGVCEINVA